MYARRPVFRPIANNGLIVSGSIGFVFECISNSSQSGVGMIAGLGGSILQTAGHPFNRRGIVCLEATPTASNQGIYTCSIPDSTDNQFVINVGVYPNGFSSEL